jgi:hypothetical protein
MRIAFFSIALGLGAVVMAIVRTPLVEDEPAVEARIGRAQSRTDADLEAPLARLEQAFIRLERMGKAPVTSEEVARGDGVNGKRGAETDVVERLLSLEARIAELEAAYPAVDPIVRSSAAADERE